MSRLLGIRNRVELWDVESGTLEASVQVDNSVNGLSFAPDGRTLAALSREGTLRVVSIPDLAELHVVAAAFGGCAAAYAPDGKLLATNGQGENSVMVWNAATHEPVATLEGHAGPVVDLTFTPDNRTLVTGSHDGNVKLWDVASRRQTRTLRSRHHIWSVAVSPDGNTIVSGGSDGYVGLWPAASSAEARTASQERVRVLSEAEATRAIDDQLIKLRDLRSDDDRREAQCDVVAGLDIGRRGRRLRRATLLYKYCQRPEAAFAEFARVIEMAPLLPNRLRSGSLITKPSSPARAKA